ncbi:hypothetical protein [Budvicia diplopodorum]|uniref:hypothetical protein n=1 Tax=Budvicia diplopodorum TaxID=1119056 RepID=UPI0013574C98|nr:hypothetical protein [Budvicia diplopodorum]
MKKILLVSLFPLLLLTGCSNSNTGNWFKQDTSAEMADQDREHCETQSRSSANRSLQSDPLGEVNTSDNQISKILETEQHQFNLIGECMRSKGYDSF